MKIHGLAHYTLRCDADQLEALRSFYASVLGLTPGARPDLKFGGYWLYADGQPIVHLYASGKAPTPDQTALDHIAFRAAGLAQMKAFLAREQIAYTEAPVPGWPLHQLFLRDPTGLKIELTYELQQEGPAA